MIFDINFIQDEDNALLKYAAGDKNHNYFIEKIKGKNNQKIAEKNINQSLFEILNKRNKAIGFIYDKFKENNFSNNVKILQKMNHNLYKEILLAEKRQAEAEEEANLVLNAIAEKKITYPIAIDMEFVDNDTARIDTLTKDEKTLILYFDDYPRAAINVTFTDIISNKQFSAYSDNFLSTKQYYGHRL